MKKNVILFVILGTFQHFVFSQGKQGQERVDSLLAQLPKLKEDTTKVNTLNFLSKEYEISDNRSKGLLLGSQALLLSTKINYKKGQAKAYKSIGNNYSDMNQSLKCYLYSLKISEDLADKQEMYATIGTIGLIYSYQQNYPKALEMFLNNLKFSESLVNKEQMATDYNNIGSVYLMQNYYPKALEYYFKSLKISEALGNKQVMIFSYYNIADIYYQQSDYAQALEYNLKNLKIVEELNDKKRMSKCVNKIGIIYEEKKIILKHWNIILKA